MLWRLRVVSLLTLTTITLAALGPVSELILTSNTISPDGFPRAYAVHHLSIRCNGSNNEPQCFSYQWDAPRSCYCSE